MTEAQVQSVKPTAISLADFRKFGCPHCGHMNTLLINHKESGVLRDDNGGCGKTFQLLAEGEVVESDQPAGGGEFFVPGDIGPEITPGCFVCGGHFCLHKNSIFSFVRSKNAAERLVAMFGGLGARTGLREVELGKTQVYIGACNKHLANMEKLREFAVKHGCITEASIIEARAQ